MRRLFISYCREDAELAATIREKLEELGIPSWQDVDLYGGQNWRSEIDLAVRGALAVLVVLTPRALESAYLQYEWAYALGAGVNVIPVAAGVDPETLHPALRSRQCLEMTGRSEGFWELLVRAIEGAGVSRAPSTVHVPAEAPPVVEQAARALDSLDPKERATAVESFRTMKHPAVGEVLLDALHHPFADVRIGASAVLLEYRDVRALPGLLEGIRLGSFERSPALAGLGQDAVAPLSEALRDESPEVRRDAARALGWIGHADAIPGLRAALGDPEESVRDTVLRALGSLRNPVLLPVFEDAYKDPVLREAAVTGASMLPDDAGVPLMLQALRAPDRDLRHHAVSLLQDAPTPAALQGLVAALTDPYDQVRVLAARTLEKIADPRASTALTDALEDESATVADAAIRALAAIRGPAAVGALCSFIADPSRINREGAARALEEIGDPAAEPALVALLSDGDEGVRAAACGALCPLVRPASTAGSALATALGDPSVRVRRSAAGALWKAADPATVPALAAALRDAEDDVSGPALQALREINTADSRAAITEWRRQSRRA